MFYTYLQGRAIMCNYSIMQTHYEYLQHPFPPPPPENLAELCVKNILCIEISEQVSRRKKSLLDGGEENCQISC